MHVFLQLILDYVLLGAALFPVYMRLDRHTFVHVIETTGEWVTLLACWMLLWPAIAFFVVRNRLLAAGRWSSTCQDLKVR
jgi:hypothetical protein